MPKKTKKEKIIAEYRRKLQSVVPKNPTGNLAATPQRSPESILPTYELRPQTISSRQAVVVALETSDFAAIRHDLVKTILLAVVIVLTEFLLSWQIGK